MVSVRFLDFVPVEAGAAAANVIICGANTPKSLRAVRRRKTPITEFAEGQVVSAFWPPAEPGDDAGPAAADDHLLAMFQKCEVVRADLGHVYELRLCAGRETRLIFANDMRTLHKCVSVLAVALCT